MYDRLLQGDHQSSVFRGRTVSLASAEDDRCRDPGDQHQVGVQRDGLASLQSPSKVFFSGSENCVVKCSSAWLKHTLAELFSRPFSEPGKNFLLGSVYVEELRVRVVLAFRQ